MLAIRIPLQLVVVFLAGHPDMSVAEYAAFIERAQGYHGWGALGRDPGPRVLSAAPYDFDAAIALITTGAAHLRPVCAELGRPLHD